MSGESGGVVPVRQVAPLADAVVSALGDPTRRSAAATDNRSLIARRGLWDVNMTRMENAFRSLAMAREEVV